MATAAGARHGPDLQPFSASEPTVSTRVGATAALPRHAKPAAKRPAGRRACSLTLGPSPPDPSIRCAAGCGRLNSTAPCPRTSPGPGPPKALDSSRSSQQPPVASDHSHPLARYRPLCKMRAFRGRASPISEVNKPPGRLSISHPTQRSSYPMGVQSAVSGIGALCRGRWL